MDTAMMQVDVIRDLDGNVSLGELTIIPCCISSISGSNNYQPTPYREGTDGYNRVMEKLQGTWQGFNGVPNYNQADDVTTPGTPVLPPATEETTPTVAPSAPTDPVTPPAGGDSGTETPAPESPAPETPAPENPAPPAPEGGGEA